MKASENFVRSLMALGIPEKEKFNMAKKFVDSGAAKPVKNSHAITSTNQIIIPLGEVEGKKRLFRSILRDGAYRSYVEEKLVWG